MKKPNSFKILLIVTILVVLSFIGGFIGSALQADKKYAMLIAVVLFIAFSFSAVGVYAGFKYQVGEKKLKTLNRIGLFGNMIIFLLVLTMMVYAALTPNKI